MKKILSVMLAVMMLFGALSISASAAVTPPSDKLNEITKNENVVILVFKFNGGTSKYVLPVYYANVTNENGGFVDEIVSGDYYLLPGANGMTLSANTSFNLPSVVPPDGKAFVGWDSSIDSQDFVAGARYDITADRILAAHMSLSQGIIYMEAVYEAAEPEEDTMATVLNILIKVFGSIIGILFLDGSSTAGVELVEKLLGGIM